MTDRELFEKALEALGYAAERIGCPDDDDAIGVARKALHERLAQPEQEPTVKWDASAPLVVTPHPAFQATLVAEQERKRWHKAGARAIRMAINIEREACAKVCEEQLQGKLEWKEGAIACAAAIRARGQG